MDRETIAISAKAEIVSSQGLMSGHFSMEAYPADQRWAAWCEALRSLPIDGSAALTAPPWHGTLSTLRTVQGSKFAALTGSAQKIELAGDANLSGLCLIHVISGEADFSPVEQLIRPGDTGFGLIGAGASLRFSDAFSALVVYLPQAVLDSRLTRTLLLFGGVLRGKPGFGDILGGLLGSTARALDALTPEQLRPIEITVVELIVAALTSESFPQPRTQYRDAIFHRLCKAVEASLGDPDLTLQMIAAEQGVSPRLAAKAFSAAGQTFKTYLRNRRLDHCSADLRDPAQAIVPVNRIAARWGFLDAARFSRVFQDRFGIAPRVWRQTAPLAPAAKRTHRGPPGLLPTSGLLPRAQPQRICREIDDDTNATIGPRRHHLRATTRTVHWGYFSRFLPPVLTVEPGDIVTIETLTHHAYDDYARMIQGDPDAEDVFGWTARKKNIDRRGAGPMDASVLGRGAGEGFGVHICTGPVAVHGAIPGDVLEIKLLDISPRLSQSAGHAGRSFGSNAATWWGYHYRELLTEPKPREVITIYEMQQCHGGTCAHGLYNYCWTPQTDPAGVVHATYDYPGVPVDRSSIQERHGILAGIHIPVRPHFGVIALAPSHIAMLDSVPPSYFGGNIDNWRLGAGASVFLPVAVAGGLLSVGDPHASQGDGELCGTAIECSFTGTFQLILHPRNDLPGHLADLNYPLIETPDEWVIQGYSHPNHLTELGEKAQSEVYKTSSLDLAMQDAFRKARRFLMVRQGLSEDEAISLLSVAVDFGVTQVVDGNWGMHAVIRKQLFETN